LVNSNVVASLTEFFTSKPCDVASTYSFVASESEVNPARSLYPEGTVTVPEPCGDNAISLLSAVVVID
jgi:hypothetical protein